MLSYSSFIVVVLACLGLEALALLGLWFVREKGLRPAETIAFLGAGASFAAGLLVVASGGPLYLLALALASAFVFHVLDLFLRWKK